MRKPLPPQPIKTAALPARCPACGHLDVARVDSFGIWKVTCQRPCGWSEKYQIVKEPV
jgi:ribosomal protein L37AE/L43A